MLCCNMGYCCRRRRASELEGWSGGCQSWQGSPGGKKGKLTAAAAQVEDARVSTTDEIIRGDSILPELDVLTEFIGSCLLRWSSADEFQGFEPVAAG